MTVSLLNESLHIIFKDKAIELKDLEIVVDNAAIPSVRDFITAMNASSSQALISASTQSSIGDLEVCNAGTTDENSFRATNSLAPLITSGGSRNSSRWTSEYSTDKTALPTCPVRSPPSTSFKSLLAKYEDRRRSSLSRSFAPPLQAKDASSTTVTHKALGELLEDAIRISSLPPPPPYLSPPSILKGNKKPDYKRSPLTTSEFRKTCKKANLVF